MDVIEVDAFLADSVDGAQGKIYVLGAGWDSITVQSFPARHPRIGIGVLVRVPYTATNQEHQLEIGLEDADGEPHPIGDDPNDPSRKIDRFGASFNVGRPPQMVAGDSQTVAMAVNIDGLVFTQPGRYSFVLSVDGTEQKRLPVRVASAPRLGPVRG